MTVENLDDYKNFAVYVFDFSLRPVEHQPTGYLYIAPQNNDDPATSCVRPFAPAVIVVAPRTE